MNKYIFLIIAMQSMFLASSQAKSQDLGEVTLEMLREQKSPLDSLAAGEVLYEKGEITYSNYDSWNYEFKVTRRIKIFNKEGYNQSNVQIPFFVGSKISEREIVKDINGTVYNEVNGKIQKEKLHNKEIFEISTSELWDAKRFTLPRIQDGSIIEYSYLITSPHISNLPEWTFQNDIPTRYSEYETNIPKSFLAYTIRTKGNILIDKFTDLRKKPLKGTNLSVTTEQTRHIAKQIPKIIQEPYVNNIFNFLPTISYELSSFRTGKYDAPKIISKSWKNVVKTLRETDTYKKEVYRVDYFQKELAAILRNHTKSKQKMLAVFNFVKNQMVWNGKERKNVSDKLDKIYESKVGNSADINIILLAMLKEAGLDVNPIYSSTISNGIPFSPTISGFNYVFVHVEINGEIFLLDATEKFSFPNVLPKRLLNWKGTVVKPNGFRTLNLIPLTRSSKKYQLQAELKEDGEISGKCRIISLDNFGLEARNFLNEKNKSDLKLFYENKFKISGINTISTINLMDSSKPVVEGFSFSIDDSYVESIGQKVYLSPMLFLNSQKNPFKSDKRTYPVSFDFPRNIEYFITIFIPEDYSVDYLPNKEIFKLGNGLGLLSYLLEYQNNTITLKINQQISSATIQPQDYKILQKFYISLMNKENEKIVLVKS